MYATAAAERRKSVFSRRDGPEQPCGRSTAAPTGPSPRAYAPGTRSGFHGAPRNRHTRRSAQGQLIAPFGPGSLSTDRSRIPTLHHAGPRPHFWFTRWETHCAEGRPRTLTSKPDEIRALSKPRLSRALLRVDRFRTPPDYRHLTRRSRPASNAGLQFTGAPLPRLVPSSKTGQLLKSSFNLDPPQRESTSKCFKKLHYKQAKMGGEWIGPADRYSDSTPVKRPGHL